MVFKAAAVGLAALALLLAAASGCTEDTPPTPATPVVTAAALPSPVPTPTATPDAPPTPATPTPEPTPTPTPRPRAVEVNGGYPTGPCERGHWTMDSDERFLHWTGDGSRLVFDLHDTVLVFDIEGRRLLEVADVSPDKNYLPPSGFYADVSSDGSRTVYSTCEYQLDDPPPGFEQYALKNVYEIAVVDVDGTDRRRLTQTAHDEGYPAWSPDGNYIAFASYRESPSRGMRLAIMELETGDLSWLELTPDAGLYPPPVWSPDGQRLAYFGHAGNRRTLYTIGMDGTEKTRIRDVGIVALRWLGTEAVVPSWSWDSRELAFAAVDGEEAVLYAVRPDGTELREVWRSGADPPTPITQVSWSPDGSEILFVTDQVYVVGADGSGLRSLSSSLPGATVIFHNDGSREVVGRIAAAWSPDGSRVAAYYPRTYYFSKVARPLLVTVSRDGTDLRALAGAHDDDDLRALDPPQPDRPVDLAACSAGVVVPDPEANPGLVRDCEVLLSIRDRLAGGSELNWNEKTPIAGWHWVESDSMGGWEGVIVGGEPLRVLQLSFDGRGLDGSPDLSGTLPPELSELSELRTLFVVGTYLSGRIPPELGKLSKLRLLYLFENFLTGTLPPELGELAQLEELIVSDNFLTGPLPPEWSKLSNLKTLSLDGNPLSGSIPREMAGIVSLDHVQLPRNQLTGCVPVELPELWVRQSRLERCPE